MYSSFSVPMLHRFSAAFRHTCRFAASSGLRFFCFIAHFTTFGSSGDHHLGHTVIPHTECMHFVSTCHFPFPPPAHNCLCYSLSFLITTFLTCNILYVLADFILFFSKNPFLYLAQFLTLQSTVETSQPAPIMLSATVQNN